MSYQDTTNRDLKGPNFSSHPFYQQKASRLGTFYLSVEQGNSHLCGAVGWVCPSLKDVSVLTFLPLSGDTQSIWVVPDREDQEKLDSSNALSDSRYSANEATFLSWIRHFEEAVVKASKYQVEALPSYRFSYFPSPEDGLNNYVFALAIFLAKGKRLALAPLYLGSLYNRLDECVHNIFCSLGPYNVVSYADTAFLEMFLWKEVWGFIANMSLTHLSQMGLFLRNKDWDGCCQAKY